MFNGILKSDDVEVYELSSGTYGGSVSLADNCKSNIIVNASTSGTATFSFNLPINAYSGKVINFTVFNGANGTGKTNSTTSTITIQHSNTTLFTLKQGTVSFMYVGQQLNGLTATDKSKSGWIILGGVQGDTAITGYAGSVAIGSGAYCSNATAVAIGSGASAASNAVSLGVNNLAGGTSSASVGGSGNTTGGTGASCVGGTNNTASGSYSTCFGDNNTSNGVNSIAAGKLATTNAGENRFSLGSYPRAAAFGANQSSILNMGVQTTTDTANVVLKSNVSAAGTGNQFLMINNSSVAFVIYAVGNVTATSSVMYKIEGLIRRGANASTTTLVGTPTVTQLFTDAALSTTSMSVVADTTNGLIQVRATGILATTINWNATIYTSEVI